MTVQQEHKQNLSRILRDAQAEFGMNQAQLAKRIGVAQTTISQWLKASQYPDEANRKRIADAIGMTWERFESKIYGVSFAKEPETTYIQAADYIVNCPEKEFYLLLMNAIAPRNLKLLHQCLLDPTLPPNDGALSTTLNVLA